MLQPTTPGPLYRQLCLWLCAAAVCAHARARDWARPLIITCYSTLLNLSLHVVV